MTTAIIDNSIKWSAKYRRDRLEQLDQLRDETNAEFVAHVRARVAAGDVTVTAAAAEAGLSRQVMHDLLRRYPATA